MSCADCVTGVVQQGSPSGTEVNIAGLPTYSVGDSPSSQIIVVGADVFGWRFNNNRLLADEYAARGFRVLLPDLFNGWEIPRWTLDANDPMNETPSLFQRFIARPLSMSILIPFVVRNGPAQTARITKFVENLRREQPNAKIGYIGFCWGGRYAITLNPFFDATVAAHPSQVKFPSELDAIAKPISFVVAKADHYFDGRRGEETEKLLKAKGSIDAEVVIYDGVQHGFTTRADLRDETKKKARDSAVDQVVDWFKRYLV
ncbi:alpha/beta-hydrolase [Mycena metata]|uniref:Alpha/beta-hydrolase n=1 Tax=Mycena metata TaxID=1033252 RepID=A0AAD7JWJ0_9AGAR|nr:alpha/beta-hydrolase [Mycena metata]